MIAAIVAVTKNGVIGNSGELPWYLPADLKHFKDVTMGHPVIMGRKTYESILARIGHALPGRQNIILTHNDELTSGDIVTVPSLETALEIAETDEPIVIGGAQIYELAADRVDRWYVTEIDTEIEGDVKLRGFNKDEFTETAREDHLADERNPFDYSFVTYERK